VNVSATTARRWVLVSMVGLLVLAAYKDAKQISSGGEGLFKRLWGVGVLGLMLSAAADFVPQIAGPFALLVLAGYATSGGDKAIQNVLGKVSGSGSGTAPTLGTPAGVQVPSPSHPGTNS
jgi:hypothetical protein